VRRLRLLPVAVALSLLTPSIALGAPEVRVTGGTLSIDGTDATGVSARVAGSQVLSRVFGPPAGQGTLVQWFAYGPRFVWRGAAPVPGAGCRTNTDDSEGGVVCADVARIDIALGRADDYVGAAGGTYR
jgi:hypothetical protein